MLLRGTCNDWVARETRLLEDICALNYMDKKTRCFLLETLTSTLPEGAKKLLEVMPNLINDMLGGMRVPDVAPTIGKCLVLILKTRKAELMAQDEKVLPRHSTNEGWS